MSYFIRILLAFFFFSSCTAAGSQEKKYSVANGHAHNDYLNKRPFYDAYNNGFGSIEADVFPVDGKLLVAHSKKEIRPGHTLTDLYINPLAREFELNKPRPIILLIDIKEDYRTSLGLLKKKLAPLEAYLKKPGKPNYITIVVSGERPPPAEYKNYPDFIFFDSDLKYAYSEAEWVRVALVSLPFNKISGWKGGSEPGVNELLPVKKVVDSVHGAGRPIRFWAAPDTMLAWKWQQQMQVDLIGTDKVEELAAFLNPKEND